MPRKRTDATSLKTESAKVGDPIPKAIIDTNIAAVGIPPQDPRDQIGAMRAQIETLRQQISDVARSVRGEATKAARQTEATVKLYSVSALVAVAVVSVFAFAVAGLRAAPPRSRYDRALDEMRDLYDQLRNRF
jgi:hypothetical protein